MPCETQIVENSEMRSSNQHSCSNISIGNSRHPRSSQFPNMSIDDTSLSNGNHSRMAVSENNNLQQVRNFEIFATFLYNILNPFCSLIRFMFGLRGIMLLKTILWFC